MGGSGGGIAYNREEFPLRFVNVVSTSLSYSPIIDRRIFNCWKYEMEVVRDKTTTVLSYVRSKTSTQWAFTQVTQSL